ncbi:ABC transporter permease [Brevundimonas pondensis]|uniref:ABC transporter permease n=1 Tax=Brevundimonas pondensis TaxID=2774189 RepID=UPI003207E494
MLSVLSVLSVEVRKLNRSLALLLAVAAPSLIAVFTFFMMLRAKEAGSWGMVMGSATGIWAFFMMPMSVTALTALVAHMEHGPRSWDHLRALPIPRWSLYGAKAACVIGLVVLMSAGVLGLTAASASLAAAIKPAAAPTGAFELADYARVLGLMVVAGVLMIAIQFWVAMRFASFVPALIVGIGGTFFAVVATAAKQGVFMPWQMPVNILAGEAWRFQTALALGGGLGLIVLILAVAHLARREVL